MGASRQASTRWQSVPRLAARLQYSSKRGLAAAVGGFLCEHSFQRLSTHALLRVQRRGVYSGARHALSPCMCFLVMRDLFVWRIGSDPRALGLSIAGLVCCSFSLASQ